MQDAVDVVWSRLVGEPESWLGAGALLDAVPGGRVSFDGHRGIVRRVDPGRHLSWEWSADGDPGWSVVEVSITVEHGSTMVDVIELLMAWEFESFPAQDAGGPGGAPVPAGVR
ncbi:MAG: SRPBCC domain-containing protein [Acidimicrobiia bacterium]